MWQQIVTAGGIMFWLIIAVVFVLSVAAVENERGALAGLVLVIAFAVLILFTDAQIISWSVRHVVLIVLGVIAYAAIGVGYAYLKWKALLRASRAEFDKNEATLRQNYADETATKTNKKPFNEWLKAQGFPPDATANRARIATWMGYWWASLAWTVLRYPWRFCTWATDKLVNTFRRMASDKFSDVK